MRKQLTYLLLLGIGLCFCSPTLSAQKDLDSILTSTTNKIFENPNEVIAVGTDIYETATEASTKVAALRLISNAYLSKRENSKSLEYALLMRQYLPEIKNQRTRINILNTIGMQHQQLRIYDKAIEYLDEALQMSKQVKDADSLPSILGYNYSIRGFIYREQMSCDIALNYFNKAIYQFEKISDKDITIANLSTLTYNKGNCFLQISEIDSARVNFKRSIDYAEKVGANSLYAFAKKGISEVSTAEGFYAEAIQELKEAESASEEVGDLILNQGIYKNLSDNYLAVNNRELYKIYFNKYTEVQKQISDKEKKTIDSSINNLISENDLITKKKLARLQTAKWILLGVIILVILVLGKLAFRNFKNFKNAKQKLETLKT